MVNELQVSGEVKKWDAGGEKKGGKEHSSKLPPGAPKWCEKESK